MIRPVVVACVLVTAGAAPGQEAKPEELIRNAVQAVGGADVLARFPAGRVTAKGTIHAGGVPTPVTVDQVYHAPGRMRTITRMEGYGQAVEVGQVVSGARMLQTVNGAPIPVTGAAAKELQLAMLMLEVGQLSPLLTERKFTLKAEKVSPAADPVVLVQTKGHPDLRLVFDRKTGHLVRVSRRGIDPDTGKEADFEVVLSEFKSAGGLTRPTRSVLTRDGEKVLELQTESFIPLEKVDPKEFTRGR